MQMKIIGTQKYNYAPEKLEENMALSVRAREWSTNWT